MRERLSDAKEALGLSRVTVDRMEELSVTGDVAKILAEFPEPSLERFANQLAEGDETARASFLSRFEAMLQRQKLDLARAEVQVETLEVSFAELEEKIETQNVDLIKLNQLVREADASRVLYQTFLTRLKETPVQIGLQQADGRVLSIAPKGEQVAPRVAVVLALSMILGGLVGIAFVLFRQFMHNGFRTAEELESVTGYPVMGQIPKIPIRRRKGLIEYLQDKPTSVAAEAVRNLRTSVLMSDLDNPPQIIMSTSSLPGEGKTTQSLALTQNLAGLGKKVLLIEADIRRRTFTQYFSQTAKGGLVSAALGKTTLEESIVRDDRLEADILMGDKTSMNAADFFASDAFHDFLDEMRELYDYVIIDTAPVLVVPDGRVIGQSVDTIIYTVLWDKTARVQVTSGLKEFASVGLNVAGLVLSQIDPSGMKRYGYGGKSGAYAHYGSGYYDS